MEKIEVVGTVPIFSTDEVSRTVITTKTLESLVNWGVPFLFTPQTDYAQVMCPKCMLYNISEGERWFCCEDDQLQCVMDSHGYTDRFVTFWHCVTCNTKYRLRLTTGDKNGNSVPEELSCKTVIKSDIKGISVTKPKRR